jgi:hypothetical protein
MNVFTCRLYLRFVNNAIILTDLQTDSHLEKKIAVYSWRMELSSDLGNGLLKNVAVHLWNLLGICHICWCREAAYIIK